MGWVLASGKVRIPVEEPACIVGRPQFPEEKFLSRQHFEILVEGRRVFIRDLGSTNGTYLGETRLPANENVELALGAVVRIGETQFVLRAEGVDESGWGRLSSTLKADALVFAVMALLIAADSSMALGRSLGVVGFLTVTGVLLASVFAAALAWSAVFKKGTWSSRRYAGYLTAVFATASSFYLGSLYLAHRQWNVGESFVQAKIEYFCLQNFNAGECVRQVNVCPQCALRIERWKRQAMQDKLLAVRSQQYPLTDRAPGSK